jgi:DNA-binding response OmpR family regulator
MNIAILTQNTSIFQAIKQTFEAQAHFTCVQCSDQPAVASLNRGDLALVIVDSGTDPRLHMSLLSWRICHCLFTLPCIVIGQRFDGESMIDAFNAGADDIVVGPLNLTELYARSISTLDRYRSVSTQRPVRIDFGPYSLDKQAGTVTRDGAPIPLTAFEFALTWLFFSNPGKVLSRNYIAHAIWGKDLDLVWRTLEQHIYKMRRKLKLGSASGVRMKTVYSLGYRLEFDDESQYAAPLRTGASNPLDLIPQRFSSEVSSRFATVCRP